MTSPKIMCRQHLIGEYREMFTFLGSLKKQISMAGYLKNNLFEPLSILSRFNDLKNEMIERGYKPKKEFVFDDSMIQYLGDLSIQTKVDIDKSLEDLLNRCDRCKQRFLETSSQIID